VIANEIGTREVGIEASILDSIARLTPWLCGAGEQDGIAQGEIENQRAPSLGLAGPAREQDREETVPR